MVMDCGLAPSARLGMMRGQIVSNKRSRSIFGTFIIFWIEARFCGYIKPGRRSAFSLGSAA
jgi:hypothetical protein